MNLSQHLFSKKISARQGNLVDGRQGKKMLPTKHAAKYVKLSFAIFDKHIDKETNQGVIHFQARIDAPEGKRPILGFAIGYLDEVKKVLGDERRQGHTAITPEAIERLRTINKKWDKVYPIA